MLKKLLLADDSLTIQKVVGIVFANLDYQLLIADNGEDALALARKEFPDLVIVDIGMPGMDGFALCREIKNDVNLGSTPVLLLPGAFENFDENKAVAVGADGWLTKPFESQVLIDKVEVLLAAVPENVSAITAPTPEAAPELNAVEETVDFEIPEPVVAGEFVGFESPEPVESEDLIGLEVPEPSAAEESIGFETPVIENSADLGDDMWDAVTFEEEDLQPAIAASDLAVPMVEELIQFEELEHVREKSAPTIEEFTPIVDEAAPIFEETAPIFEETAPASEKISPLVEEEFDDEILELGEDDILELDDESIIEEIAEETFDFASDETVLQDGVDEGQASPISVSPPISEQPFEPEIEAAAEPAAQVDVAAVEAQLSTLSESDLEEVVKRVAGPIIERLAAQLLEQVVWEVVPDLAESMIKDEIRKIKDGVA